MKRIYLIFALCLGIVAFPGAHADDAADTARAAVRRGGATTTTNQSPQASARTRANTGATTTTRGNADSASTPSSAATPSRNARTPNTVRERGAVVTRDTAPTRTTSTTGRSAAPQTVTSRVTTNNATVGNGVRTTTRTGTNIAAGKSRAASTSAIATATQKRNARNASSGAMARAATNMSRAATLDAVLGRDFSACRNVYYECMDEFCANKDSQLKRCACSSRIHEFDGIKKQLSAVDDKLLDFSQRLLTVNMDKEDAAALYQATEGELAFNQTKDKTASKKVLDEISKKLNSTFNNSTLESGLGAITLSLDMDSAFDSIDSLMGAPTTAKEGTDLYNAAIPICREMAAEICDENDLAIAVSGYQMAIEQDCNTVMKSYQTQTDQARARVRESGALLDMSRLDIYQKRNSDDILTCKRKMLDMLSDSAICGTGLGKCLDTTGQYIDPSTGQAFLTQNLANLGNLITRPTENQTWISVPQNQRFVTFLRGKKKFLEPAMDQCQDIADTVWDEFMEDAISQIKLAQNAKLEEMRQSCTSLLATCLTDAAESLTDFDSRALSVFGVAADKTARAMCAEIKTSCTALLNATGDDVSDWESGVTDIQRTATFESILRTCRQVGQSCITRICSSVSGNFALCEDLTKSINRKSIINRDTCWKEVENCVASAGDDQVAEIMAQEFGFKKAADLFATRRNMYYSMYGRYFKDFGETESPSTGDTSDTTDNTGTKITANNTTNIYPEQYCDADSNNLTGWAKCLLTEYIWGNCESEPYNIDSTDGEAIQPKSHFILGPSGNNTYETVLWWFAKNTNTYTSRDSCLDASCKTGEFPFNSNCYRYCDMDSAGRVYPNETASCPEGQIEPAGGDLTVYDNYKLWCATSRSGQNYTVLDTEGKRDGNNMCCMDGTLTDKSPAWTHAGPVTPVDNVCSYGSDNTPKIAFVYDGTAYICSSGNITVSCPSGEEVGNCSMTCANGTWYKKDNEYKYLNQNKWDSGMNYYYTQPDGACHQGDDCWKGAQGWMVGKPFN